MKISLNVNALNSFKNLICSLVLAIFATLTTNAGELSQNDAALSLGHSVKIKVLFFEKSKWQLNDLENKYVHVQRFFAKCDLFLDLEFISEKNVFAEPVVFPGSESMSSSQDFAEKLPHLDNTIYMIHVDAMADENGESIEGISAPKARYGASHPLVHKNWVAYPSATISLSKNIQNGLVEAHELAHDLIDSDHITNSNNILSRFAHTWQITDQQCESVRQHPKVKSLIFED